MTLTGRTVSLEPIGPEHAAALYDALCAPDDAWRWTYRPHEMPADRAASDALVAAMAADRRRDVRDRAEPGEGGRDTPP